MRPESEEKFFGIIWSDDEQVELAEALRRAFSQAVEAGALETVVGRTGQPADASANLDGKDVITVLTWTFEGAALVLGAPEVKRIVEEWMHGMPNAPQQIIAFVASQPGVVQSLREFCRRCGRKINSWPLKRHAKNAPKGAAMEPAQLPQDSPNAAARVRIAQEKEALLAQLAKAQVNGEHVEACEIRRKIDALEKRGRELTLDSPAMIGT